MAPLKTRLFVTTLFFALFPILSYSAILSDAVRYRNNHHSYLVGGLGFNQGEIGLAADYEITLEDDLTTGVYARYYSEKVKGVAFGGFFRMHFPHYSWNFYASPGIGLGSFQLGENGDSELVLTPSWAMGAMFAINKDIAVGVENMKIMGLTGDLKANLIDDFMIKVRFNL